MNHKLLLLGILLIALFFRFYRNNSLQYWNNDEEVHAWTVQRMIALGRPALVSPQPTLGTSIGSFFHILSVPLFLIAKMDPQWIAGLFSLVGIGTTAAIYFLGIEVASREVGFISAFLDASSFLAGLYDRRWWPITLTPLFSCIGLLFTIKMVKKRNSSLFPIIALFAGSALHGDPAVLFLGLFAILTVLWLRIQLTLKSVAASMIILALYIAPIALFELKHPGSIISPALMTIQRQQ